MGTQTKKKKQWVDSRRVELGMADLSNFFQYVLELLRRMFDLE